MAVLLLASSFHIGCCHVAVFFLSVTAVFLVIEKLRTQERLTLRASGLEQIKQKTLKIQAKLNLNQTKPKPNYNQA